MSAYELECRSLLAILVEVEPDLCVQHILGMEEREAGGPDLPVVILIYYKASCRTLVRVPD